MIFHTPWAFKETGLYIGNLTLFLSCCIGSYTFCLLSRIRIGKLKRNVSMHGYNMKTQDKAFAYVLSFSIVVTHILYGILLITLISGRIIHGFKHHVDYKLTRGCVATSMSMFLFALCMLRKFLVVDKKRMVFVASVCFISLAGFVLFKAGELGYTNGHVNYWPESHETLFLGLPILIENFSGHGHAQEVSIEYKKHFGKEYTVAYHVVVTAAFTVVFLACLLFGNLVFLTTGEFVSDDLMESYKSGKGTDIFNFVFFLLLCMTFVNKAIYFSDYLIHDIYQNVTFFQPKKTLYSYQKYLAEFLIQLFFCIVSFLFTYFEFSVGHLASLIVAYFGSLMIFIIPVCYTLVKETYKNVYEKCFLILLVLIGFAIMGTGSFYGIKDFGTELEFK